MFVATFASRLVRPWCPRSAPSSCWPWPAGRRQFGRTPSRPPTPPTRSGSIATTARRRGGGVRARHLRRYGRHLDARRRPEHLRSAERQSGGRPERRPLRLRLHVQHVRSRARSASRKPPTACTAACSSNRCSTTPPSSSWPTAWAAWSCCASCSRTGKTCCRGSAAWSSTRRRRRDRRSPGSPSYVANNPAIAEMLPGDQNLSLQQLDNEWKALPARPPVRCAYEKRPTRDVMVVQVMSATRFCDGTPVAIDADHLHIVKPDRASPRLGDGAGQRAQRVRARRRACAPCSRRLTSSPERDHLVFTMTDPFGRSVARLNNTGGSALRYTIGRPRTRKLFVWPDDTPRTLPAGGREQLRFGLGFGATATEYRLTLTSDVSDEPGRRGAGARPGGDAGAAGAARRERVARSRRAARRVRRPARRSPRPRPMIRQCPRRSRAPPATASSDTPATCRRAPPGS